MAVSSQYRLIMKNQAGSDLVNTWILVMTNRSIITNLEAEKTSQKKAEVDHVFIVHRKSL